MEKYLLSTNDFRENFISYLLHKKQGKSPPLDEENLSLYYLSRKYRVATNGLANIFLPII